MIKTIHLHRALPWLSVMFIGALLLVTGCTANAIAEGVQDHSKPVVIELFTSQGCSSCPPADRVLSDITTDASLSNVYPLSFHVDYWNYIGWKDPFSKADWSARQKSYAAAHGSNRIYTPQAIIDGREDCTGSRRACITQAIRNAQRRATSANVTIKKATLADDKTALEVTITSTLQAARNPVHVMIATHNSGLKTTVVRGENRGHTLRNDCVVRDLKRALVIPISDREPQRRNFRIPLKSQWLDHELGVTVFLQDSKTKEILTAARATIR